MKVYLIKTPEYEAEDFNEVCNLLSSFEGPIEFIPSSYEFVKDEFYFLQYELYPYHLFEYPDNDTAIHFDSNREFPLSWRELFSLGQFYREVFSIDDESFVVLLTNRKNSLNWFSATDISRNIFVHTAEWDIYTRVNSKYPIAYQVVENIMQSLMNINIYNLESEYIHQSLKGCMNDFCDNKTQIIIKLQTANICAVCMNKIKEENVPSSILKQVKTIFNGIRNEFVFQEEEHPAEPVGLVIDKKGKILLPTFNLEIKLTPLFKTLYLFLLSKPNGVSVSELSNHKEELISIYKKLRPNVSNEDAKDRIDNLTHPLGDGFNPNRSHINKAITTLLKESLAPFYLISGTAGSPYKIEIPRNLVDIRF